MAGRGLDEGGRKSAGGVIPIVLAPEARSPGQKSPRMERRKASAGRIFGCRKPRVSRETIRCCAMRRSISPHGDA